MNIKKFISVTAALALCAGLLTACGNGGGSAESDTSASSSASGETSAAESESESLSDESSDVSEGNEAGSSAEEEKSENPLQPLVDAALSSADEWPSLWEVTDPQMLSDFFLLDAENENYKNMIVMQCPMSANMMEIIIIEALDTEAAKADLEARQKKAQDQDAFYPNDVELAAASIVGTEGDYAYFILASGAEAAEAALVDAIKAL